MGHLREPGAFEAMSKSQIKRLQAQGALPKAENKKFALHPGEVYSPSDGDVHHISAQRLAELYKVDFNNCVVWDSSRPETFLGRKKEDYVHLYPSTRGSYKLP